MACVMCVMGVSCRADVTPADSSWPAASAPDASVVSTPDVGEGGAEDVPVPVGGGPEVLPPVPGGSLGCGSGAPKLSTELSVSGETRTFVLDLPIGYNPNTPAPLLFAWHGLGGSGAIARGYFGFANVAGETAIIVYPNALPLADFGGEAGWDLSPFGYDFQFFDALYEHLVSTLCVDVGRVFSTGHSFGGYMSNSLGCYRGGRFDAIGPVAGGPPRFGPCDGQVAV